MGAFSLAGLFHVFSKGVTVKNLRTVLAVAIVTAGTFSLNTSTAIARNRTIDKALKQQYPDAETKITNQETINGVKINEVRVTTDYGQSTALVTEHGDFLLAGKPLKDGKLPVRVDESLSDLFRERPQNVQAFSQTAYYVTTEVGDKPYRIRLDATGRVRDVSSAEEIRRERSGEARKASTDIAETITRRIEKSDESAKVQGVYEVDESRGFYQVDLQGEDGPRKIIMNEDGVVLLENEQIQVKDLPEPVRESVERVFQSGKITRVSRGTSDFFQFEQPLAQGDPLVIKMSPSGDILDITDETADREERAITARAEQKPTQRDERQRDREDEIRENRIEREIDRQSDRIQNRD